jgi:chromosome partitioning protein
MAKQELVGIAEVADFAKVSKQAVANWRLRYDHFPKPLQQLQSGPVWDRETVQAWVKNFRGEETHVLSFINLKGGAGTTTTAVAVAEILAQDERRHVLLIDLDPQTDATISLISEEQWEERDREGRTLAQLLDDRLNPQEPPKFDIERAIARQVSTINSGIARLDLLPSSIRLLYLQDHIQLIALSGNFVGYPLEILRSALQPVIDRYDYIIIDCPHNLGATTKNGLRISTGYIIPAIPDIVSTWGIYQIVDNIDRFAKDINRPIPALGIVATMVRQNDLTRRVTEDLKARRLGHFAEPGALPQPPLFKSLIPQTIDVVRGVTSALGTFKGKYGAAYEPLKALTQEIMQICEKKRV